jgi:ABC-type uncharacterized transport system involved in gliding motility auxiliary subunit
MKKLGFIFFLVSGLSLACLFVLRLLLGGWVTYLWIPLGLFIAGLVAGMWCFRGLYKEFFALKTTKEGLSMGAMITLVLVLLVGINFLGARKYKTFDFSTSHVNSLSDQTKKILQGLKDNVSVIFFYKDGTEGLADTRRAFQDLVQKYQDLSANVKLQFVEVNQNPKMAEDFGVTKGSGVVFLTYQGRKARIEKIDEQELTGALVKVTREKDKKVFYLIGHHERDFEDAKEANGLSLFKKLLENNRYEVNPLNLNQAPEVPADADLLIVAGPEQALLDHEIKAIENYLARGGSVILALQGADHSGLSQILQKVGLEYEPQIVVQVMDTPLGRAINPASTPVTEFSTTNPITRPFGKGEFTLMRLPSYLKRTGSPTGMNIDEFLRTDSRALAYKDASFEGKSQAGPFTVGASISGVFPAAGKDQGKDQKNNFQLLVFSDVDFLSNQLLYKNLNRDLALNSVAYLVKENNIISITPKEVDVTQLTLTPTQFYIFIFGFVIPLPLLLMITSGVLWYRRRFA